MRATLDDVLLHGQNSTILEAAHTLLRTLSSDKKYARAMDTSALLSGVLDNLGFGGLWRACSMGNMDDIYRDYFELIEKLIEVSGYNLALVCLTFIGFKVDHYDSSLSTSP
jgi:neurofibromin 1